MSEDKKINAVQNREITEEMQDSFLDYSMSVIVDRALPDVRDGLKPVHRRVLYSMHNTGMTHSRPYKKSARLVGDVMAKYHPHGDSAIYDTMVRMAQDFSLRYPLVDGQGNFGSMDGDEAAAMRYTEARMTSVAEEMLADLEKETVDFMPNYDGTLKEPKVLPAKLPNLIINGLSGIAVGMATSIPPHNLQEIVDATCHIIENPDASIEDLMKFVKGPDFPTGAQIFDKKAILQTYATGKGGIVIRGEANIEEAKNGSFRIIISSLPYMVNKASLVEKIAELVKDKKLEGIRDLRDESGREEAVRIVVELKRDTYPKKILNQIYNHTQLQSSFHVNMLALVDGLQPRVLNLKGVLEYFIAHRLDVVTKRLKYELKKAKERAHILEGLKKALDHIDAIIKTIKSSKTKEIAHESLMKKFKFTAIQATAILEMKLQTLAGLERKKIEDELEEKRKLIKELESILKSKARIMGIITDELKGIAEKYGDERRTKVFSGPVGEFSQEDLVPNEEVAITLTKGGYIKRLPIDTYKSQGRGGKGVIGMTTKEEDIVEHLFATTSHSEILFFTNKGRVFNAKAYEIPESSRQAKGQAIVNFLQLAPEEHVTGVISLKSGEMPKFLFMVTKKGTAKKTKVEDFANVRRSGLIAITIKQGDELRWVKGTSGNSQIMIVTSKGQSVRFKEGDVRPMGRTASGVRAIKLKGDDVVIGMDDLNEAMQKQGEILNITENGYGKRSELSEYKVQKRGGSGIKTANVTTKTGKLVSMDLLSKEQITDCDIIAMSTKGQVIRTSVADISLLGRATQGVRIMKLEQGDKVATITVTEGKETPKKGDEEESKESKPKEKIENPAPQKEKKESPKKEKPKKSLKINKPYYTKRKK